MDKSIRGERGVTMVYIIVTIVVILVLGTASMRAVLSETGLLRQGKRLGDLREDWVAAEEENVRTLVTEHSNIDVYPEGPNNKVYITSIINTDHYTMIAEDIKGNQIVVPGGFKIAEDSGETVQEGIVIEDEDGNQFVWIPVSNINHDGSNKIIKDDGTEVEITLGRYTFNVGTLSDANNLYSGIGNVSTEEGTYQYAVNHDTTVEIDEQYIEATSKQIEYHRVAKNLSEFIQSVEENKGYYIARYESSFGGGSGFGLGNSYSKPLSKVSIETTLSETIGSLWDNITQPNAAVASRNMYYGNLYIESDLINSYAWDTAITYIQEMSDSGYSCANNYSTGRTTEVLNTGHIEEIEGVETIKDEKCKIFDMASNLKEWTTEYINTTDTPCITRGGYWNGSEYHTSYRSEGNGVAEKNENTTFRTILYCK